MRRESEGDVERVKMGARTMSGFARVQPEGYATDAALKKWVVRALGAAASLPAGKSRKPAARKAPKRRGKR